MSEGFTVFGFDACPFCRNLKTHLADLGIPFAWVPEGDAERRKALYRQWAETHTAPGQSAPSSMPQLFIDGVRMGGWGDVDAMPKEWLLTLAGQRP